MTQMNRQQRRPRTPAKAACCRRAIDGRLDVGLFKALGEATRARLAACIAKCGRGCSVGEIAECCDVDLSVISRHLKVLERAGVLSASKSGRVVMYRVEYARLAGSLRALAEAVEACGAGCGEEGDCGC